jgi:alkanesulfonate monooxygenase SsuD/methylene tetrahydromethanopterin reductase-like flavin-dependent oxidoreductase (luciferase family)
LRISVAEAGSGSASAGARTGVLAGARKAEALGYDVFVMSDHPGTLAPIPLLMMAAENVGMRVGTYVLCNDFHNPSPCRC